MKAAIATKVEITYRTKYDKGPFIARFDSTEEARKYMKQKDIEILSIDFIDYAMQEDDNE